MKTKYIYFSRVFNKKYYGYKELLIEKTPKFFMCVEYAHPEMNNKILIPVDKEYYFVNNEILSSVFVLKFLEHQSEVYIFDEKYKLEIMDNHMKIFTLNYNQYISLEKDGYIVCEL